MDMRDPWLWMGCDKCGRPQQLPHSWDGIHLDRASKAQETT